MSRKAANSTIVPSGHTSAGTGMPNGGTYHTRMPPNILQQADEREQQRDAVDARAAPATAAR